MVMEILLLCKNLLKEEKKAFKSKWSKGVIIMQSDYKILFEKYVWLTISNIYGEAFRYELL